MVSAKAHSSDKEIGSKLTEKSPKIMRSWLIIFNLRASIGLYVVDVIAIIFYSAF